MSRYEAYPEYKASGVEWLGNVPEHWNIHSLKRTVDAVTNGIWGNEPDELNDLIVLRVADFNRNELNISDDKLTFRAIEAKDRPSRLLKKGDLLIEKSGGGDKTLVGCVVLFDKEYPAVTSNFVAKMSPLKGFDSSFLRYAFSQLYAGRVNFPSIKQTTGIQNLDSGAYLMEPFAFPPYQEQYKIANFLVHETSEIDTLIEKQQQLIKLLTEKRQAVISHAVTKGLNPDAPMKDSGVAWLKQVPAHCDVCLIKYKCNEITDGAHISPETEGGEYYFVSIKDIKSGVINFEGALLTSEKSYEYLVKTRCMPFSGDILFSKDGTIGQTAITPEATKFVVASSLIIIRPNRDLVIPSYLDFLLQSALVKEQVESFVKGAALRRLSIQNLMKVFGVFPPIDEQNRISSYIQAQVLNFQLLEDKAYEQVKLLQERRTALISAAVTGKIDVRNWKPTDNKNTEKVEVTA